MQPPNEYRERSCGFSKEQTARFLIFSDIVTSGRYGLLLNNHLDRLRGVTGNLAGWTEVIRDVLSRDSSGVSKIVESIQFPQEKILKINGLVRSTA